MTNQFRGILALCATLALAGAACAQTVILSAEANSSQTTLTITGKALQPVSGTPLVSLGSHVLSVVNFTNTQITASLPANLASGSYTLSVTAKSSANFDMTVGASGAQGPPGPAGPAGPAGPVGPAGPQGAPGTGISLPYLGIVASPNGSAFTLLNTAGSGMSVYGGVTAEVGTAAIGALGGGGSGVTTGGPAFSGTGGIGTNRGGDGIDVAGGAVTGLDNFQSGGYGVSAIGGAAGIGAKGGTGINTVGGAGDANGEAAGIFSVGGSVVSGNCVNCVAGPGGVFQGGFAADGGASSGGGDGIDVYAGGGLGMFVLARFAGAAAFQGDVNIVGNLSKSGGSFQIDHPLDPANKYLYHSFVESPDMKNVYDGTVVTDGGGRATVALPDWFEALNSDFRYQLTVIGQFSQAIVASKISHNAFAIRTDKPNVEVSWQVTGIRQDAWAMTHRIPVEAEKARADQGHYLHPELFDHAGEPSIAEVHHPRPKPRQ